MLVKVGSATPLVKTLLDYSNEIIIFLSRDFKILEFNKRAVRFYGWHREEVLGKSFVSLCAKYQYDCPVDQGFFARQDHAFEIKSTVNSTYGKLQVVSWNIRSDFFPEASDVAIVLMGSNLSFKEVEDSHNLGNIIAGEHGSLYWKDKSGRYLGCNEYMRKLTHLSSIDEVVNKTDYDLWPDQAEQLVQNDQYVIRTGKTLYAEEVVQTGDGKAMLFTSHKMPLRDKDGRVAGVIGNSLDITRLTPPESEISPRTTYFAGVESPVYSSRVLLVEDDILMQKATIAKLQKFHAMVDIVGTGAQAIEQLKKRNYQLVYMDLGLPDMPGYAVTEVIRQWEYEQERDALPIIALAEQVDEINKAHCLNSGMNFVLQKPLMDESVEKIMVTFVIDRSFITAQRSVRRTTPLDKIIDLTLGTELAGGDGKMATNMLGMLAAELPKNRRLIDEAYRENDPERLTEAIRQLQGNLCYCGVPRLKRALETVEVNLIQEPKSLDQICRKLCNEIDVFLAAYTSSL